MTELRILNIIIWGAMMIYMALGAWAVVSGGARRGDPMRLACFLTGAVFVGYHLRALFWPGNETAANGLHVAAALIPVYIICLGRAYGRGEHV